MSETGEHEVIINRAYNLRHIYIRVPAYIANMVEWTTATNIQLEKLGNLPDKLLIRTRADKPIDLPSNYLEPDGGLVLYAVWPQGFYKRRSYSVRRVPQGLIVTI